MHASNRIDSCHCTRNLSQRNFSRAGFTLIELLVVITIIAILIALLLPGVQMIRETASKIQCSNHVSQLAKACLNHEQNFKHFPTGGWGHRCVGLARNGVDNRQPGGWIYNILPFIDQQIVYELGIHEDKEKLTQMVQTPLQILHCPSRRPPQLYPQVKSEWAPHWISNVKEVARNDYVVNGGSTFHSHGAGSSNPNSGAVSASGNNGISYRGSMVYAQDIRDGLTNTYLVGEKYLNPTDYLNGKDLGDNENAFTGDDYDLLRYGTETPKQDRRGLSTKLAFGSSHLSSMNMAMCDGSVHSISYSIDPDLHKNLCNRADGKKGSLLRD